MNVQVASTLSNVFETIGTSIENKPTSASPLDILIKRSFINEKTISDVVNIVQNKYAMKTTTNIYVEGWNNESFMLRVRFYY